MRVLIVALALATVPFLAARGQDRDHDRSERCKHTTFVQHDAHDAGHSHDPDAQDKKCDAPPPPPPPTSSCGPTSGPGGTSSISGQVLNATTNVGESGWCIQALANGSAVLGATTDASGNYTLSGLVGDTTMYLVCEVQQSGSTQTFPAGVPLPACPSGALGYSFQLNTGNASGVDFWDSTP